MSLCDLIYIPKPSDFSVSNTAKNSKNLTVSLCWSFLVYLNLLEKQHHVEKYFYGQDLIIKFKVSQKWLMFLPKYWIIFTLWLILNMFEAVFRNFVVNLHFKFLNIEFYTNLWKTSCSTVISLGRIIFVFFEIQFP